MKHFITSTLLILFSSSLLARTFDTPDYCLYTLEFGGAPAPTGKKLFSKTVWSSIALDQRINKPAFLPQNEEISGFDTDTFEVTLDYFDARKESIKWNLFTILKYHVLKGDIIAYASRNPNWIDTKDRGFLNYPIDAKTYGDKPDGTYSTDDKLRETIKGFELFGWYDYEAPLVPMYSLVYLGEDSIDNNGNLVYFPREYIWYNDGEIVQYNIKEKWIINANGEVQDKIIEAIAPVINKHGPQGEILGTKELFWVDYSALKNYLGEYFVLLDRYRTERVLSYLDYFEQREFYGEIESEEEVQIKAE